MLGRNAPTGLNALMYHKLLSEVPAVRANVLATTVTWRTPHKFCFVRVYRDERTIPMETTKYASMLYAVTCVVD